MTGRGGDGERWAYRAPTLCQNQHGNTGKQMGDGLNDRPVGRVAKGRVRLVGGGGLFTEQQPLIPVKELALRPPARSDCPADFTARGVH